MLEFPPVEIELLNIVCVFSPQVQQILRPAAKHLAVMTTPEEKPKSQTIDLLQMAKSSDSCEVLSWE